MGEKVYTERDLKEEWSRLGGNLKTLRDELLLNIHLGSQEAQDSWNSLEKKIHRMFEDTPELRKMSDEARLNMHLAMMDFNSWVESKKGWVSEIEKAGNPVEDALVDLVKTTNQWVEKTTEKLF